MKTKYIKNLKSMVLQVLRDFPMSRDSDAWLTVKLWCVFYPSRIQKTEWTNPENGKTKDRKFIYLDDIIDLPKEDQVKRVRAIIQNEENKFLPTSLDVAKQRKINEDTWREYITSHPKLPL